jgi:hypothetical protein
MTDWAQLDPKPLRALAEWLAPDSAETAEDLWQVLLTSRPGGDTIPMGAASLLTKHRGQGQPGALVTALLLCACRRWELCTGALIKDVVEKACSPKRTSTTSRGCSSRVTPFGFAS